MKNKDIVIIGNGKMAEAIIAGLYKDYNLTVIGRDIKKLKILKEKFNIKIDLLDRFNLNKKDIILAIKPYALEEISKQLNGKANILISILAGTTLEQLKKINSKNYIRVMPNLSATYKKSMTTLTGDIDCKDDVMNIFNNIGSTLWLNTEKELDIATGIAGSGPAFLAIVAEALADGGVNCGLKRIDSQKLVNGLFNGFPDLINNNHPAILKDNVMSPAGTTSAGVKALERNGVRNAFIEAIEEAYQRALGK